jgi:hypothetical protein
VRPALLEGNFYNHPFHYSPQAVQRILDYLTSGQQPIVETTQLQILCSHIERLGKAFITVDDIPEFDNIFLQFYDESIACLAQEDQAVTRAFIENKLILNGQRIAYHRLVCLESMSEQSLDLLLRERHLLRTERSSTGGISYELSHDTLIAPILLAKKRREVEEGRRARELENKQLREVAAKDRLASIQARRQLAKTRLLLGFAVLGIVVASLAFYYARHIELEAIASAEEAIRAGEEAERQRAKAENYADRIQARNDSLVRELIRDARLFVESHSRLYARINLGTALQLDPDNVEAIKLLEEIRE